MKNKSLIYLLVAMVALLVIFFGVKSARNVTEKSEPLVKVDSTKISAFLIKNATGTFKLQKTGEDWSIVDPVNFPSDPRFVHDLINKLGAMEIETIISEDTSKYDQYQVGATGADLTVLSGNETISHLIIGKMNDSRSHTYLRKVGDKKIYMVKGILTGQLNRQVRDWRNKSVIDLEREAVNKIDFTNPKESFSLVKVDSARWNLVVGGRETPATNQGEVDHSLSAVSKLRCFDFVDGDTVKLVDYAKAEGWVTIHTTSGESFKLGLIAQDAEKNRWLIKKEGVDNTLFIVYRGTAVAILRHPDEFTGVSQSSPTPNMPPNMPPMNRKMPKMPIPRNP